MTDDDDDDDDDDGGVTMSMYISMAQVKHEAQ